MNSLSGLGSLQTLGAAAAAAAAVSASSPVSQQEGIDNYFTFENLRVANDHGHDQVLEVEFSARSRPVVDHGRP